MRPFLYSLLLLPVLGSAALASDTHYAVVAFANPTNVTIHYQFKWGDGEWQSFSVGPGQVHWHSWTYDYANQNHSPVPYIRFDGDLSVYHVDLKSYRLNAYASPYPGSEYAKNYSFFADDYDTMLELVGTN